MSGAPTLFGDPTVRRSDPQASHDAARHASAGIPTSRGLMLAAFRRLGHATAGDAAEWLVRHGHVPVGRMDSHRRRTVDLEADGLLEPVDTSPHGTIYRLTGPGRMAAASVLARIDPE